MNNTFVCLHGMTGGPGSFAGLAIPGAFCPRLAGHGPDGGPRVASFEAELARLASEIRAQFSSPVRLLGYSLGARVGLGLVIAYPALFLDATLISANPGLRTEDERAERRLDDEKWIDLLSERGVSEFEARWSALPLFQSQRGLPQATIDAQRQERLCHTSEGLVHAFRQLGLAEMPNYWPKLPTISLPMTWVVGSEDPKFLAIAQDAQIVLPSLGLFKVENSGHNVLLEAPDRLRSFLLSEQP